MSLCKPMSKEGLSKYKQKKCNCINRQYTDFSQNYPTTEREEGTAPTEGISMETLSMMEDIIELSSTKNNEKIDDSSKKIVEVGDSYKINLNGKLTISKVLALHFVEPKVIAISFNDSQKRKEAIYVTELDKLIELNSECQCITSYYSYAIIFGQNDGAIGCYSVKNSINNICMTSQKPMHNNPIKSLQIYWSGSNDVNVCSVDENGDTGIWQLLQKGNEYSLACTTFLQTMDCFSFNEPSQIVASIVDVRDTKKYIYKKLIGV